MEKSVLPVFSARHQCWMLVGFLVLTFCAPLPSIWCPPTAWYSTLIKPSWSPPGWIFGPVWTLLYTMMAVAAWWVWRRGGGRGSLIWYGIQLSFNALWTPVFFGAHAPGWALVVIGLLWTAILLTMIAFFRVSRLAGWLMVPYLLWTSFATFLNFTLWRMNGG